MLHRSTTKGPSLYYVRTFLDLFWLYHHVTINTVMNCPFLNSPCPLPDVMYGWFQSKSILTWTSDCTLKWLVLRTLFCHGDITFLSELWAAVHRGSSSTFMGSVGDKHTLFWRHRLPGATFTKRPSINPVVSKSYIFLNNSSSPVFNQTHVLWYFSAESSEKHCSCFDKHGENCPFFGITILNNSEIGFFSRKGYRQESCLRVYQFC